MCLHCLKMTHKGYISPCLIKQHALENVVDWMYILTNRKVQQWKKISGQADAPTDLPATKSHRKLLNGRLCAISVSVISKTGYMLHLYPLYPKQAICYICIRYIQTGYMLHLYPLYPNRLYATSVSVISKQAICYICIRYIQNRLYATSVSVISKQAICYICIRYIQTGYMLHLYPLYPKQAICYICSRYIQTGYMLHLYPLYPNRLYVTSVSVISKQAICYICIRYIQNRLHATFVPVITKTGLIIAAKNEISRPDK
jgi:hypothetical protein